MPAKKTPLPRLPVLQEDKLNPDQRALLDSLREGPRGTGVQIRGPFAVLLYAPAYGELTQKLGAHVRFSKLVPHRLTELAILVTASLWRSQYEWHMHALHAAKAGISDKIINDIRMGRVPKGLTKDERAIYDFVKELHKDKRVSDRTYREVNSLLGDAGTVELVGLLGYYAMVAMTLNVFRMPVPDGSPLPFPEAVRRGRDYDLRLARDSHPTLDSDGAFCRLHQQLRRQAVHRRHRAGACAGHAARRDDVLSRLAQ